jgi:hypothetical protein
MDYGIIISRIIFSNCAFITNSSIRKAIRKRNHIHYRAKSTNNPDHWSQYRHLRNDVIRLVREAKTEYKNKLTSQLMDKSIPPDKW